MTSDIVNGKRVSELGTVTALTETDKLMVQTANGSKIIRFDKLKEIITPKTCDYFNEGRDLTVLFADEIATYGDAWAWIQARLDAHNLDDLRDGDYIPVTMSSGEVLIMQIAGINTYEGIFSGAVKPHIDWISRDCLATTHNWNASNDNNGTSAEAQPFMASAVYAWLNSSDVYGKLPEEVRAVIKGKRLYMPTRYSASGKLTDDGSWADKTFPHLWLPFEGEIFDHISWSTKGFGTACCVQYPLFAHSWKARMKGQGNSGTPVHWWTASSHSGSATHAVYVSAIGLSTNSPASNVLGVSVCFRTMAAA